MYGVLENYFHLDVVEITLNFELLSFEFVDEVVSGVVLEFTEIGEAVSAVKLSERRGIFDTLYFVLASSSSFNVFLI